MAKTKIEMWNGQPRFVDTSCVVCRECIFDRKYRRCDYGGPFRGFSDVSGALITDSTASASGNASCHANLS